MGDITEINSRDRFNDYFDSILEGLRLRQQWASELFLQGGRAPGAGLARTMSHVDEELCDEISSDPSCTAGPAQHAGYL